MSLLQLSDEHFMKMALQQAQLAFEEGEIPVGAVVVSNDKIIAKAYNQVEKLNDVTAHAEILAITSAQNHLQSKYLENCTLYVTLEPCTMCAGALFWSQIDKVVIGAQDEKRGYRRHKESVIHPKTEVVYDILSEECSSMMSEFFSAIRERQKRK